MLAASDRQCPVHIHIAEQQKEVDDCLAWSGLRPLQWLYEHVDVDRRWCLVHATHAEPDEVTAMARSGAVAGLCLTTEATWAMGSSRQWISWHRAGVWALARTAMCR